MAKPSVRYRKQAEMTKGLGALSATDALTKVKELAAVKSDRTYKNGRKRNLLWSLL